MDKVIKPKITISIPTYNREEVLVDTIKDVLKQSFEEFELIVVDQTKKHKKKTDDFIEKVKRDKRMRYFRVSPPSLPAARNFALDRARSNVIIFIDDDVILTKDFIKHHYLAHQKEPALAAVAGRVRHRNRKPSKKLFFFDFFGFENESFDYTRPQEATTFPGGNVSLKVDTVKELGGFDPNYTGSALREESDLAWRIKKAGYKIFYEPRASLLHLAAPSGGTRIFVPQRDNLSYYQNDLYYTMKTVHPIVRPFVYAVKFVRYAKARSFSGVVRRSALFIKGLSYATSRKAKPVDIVQREMK